MALISPGVSVTVIAEAGGSGQGPGTVPFILVATRQDKTIPDGSEVASGTLKQNSNSLYLVTSQRDLLQTFGTPDFMSVGGSQINGSPLNEYGLLTAHSYLGIANRAYVMRADIDLGELEPRTVEPTSPVSPNSYWMDLTESDFGVFEYNGDTWVKQETNFFFDDDTDASASSAGVVGDYGMIVNQSPVRYVVKTTGGGWVALEDATFLNDYQVGAVWPTLQSDGSTPLASGDVWVKSSPASNGASVVTRVMSATLQQFVTVQSPLLASDSAANSYYGDNLSTGSVYIMYASEAANPPTNPGGINLYFKVYNGSAWVALTNVTAALVEPTNGPTNGALWYNPEVGLDNAGLSTIDLLVNDGVGSWRNVNLPGFVSAPSQPTLYAQPTNPLDTLAPGTLVNNDLWVDTSSLDEYPVIRKWKASTSAWILIDNADQTTNNGILFTDCRPSPTFGADNGVNNGATVGAPDLDADRPDPDAYPAGMLLWNTRYSTMNVKEWVVGHTSGGVLIGDRWVTKSGNKVDGSPYMGVDAQRIVVVNAMQASVVGNEELSSEDIFFNLIVAPGFPELMGEMVVLNANRKNTAFVIGDAPFNLAPTGTALQNWATNANGAVSDGNDGLVSSSEYLSVHYPSCAVATNIDGQEVVVPSSHGVLRTYGYNDQIAYPWYAPAGHTRGVMQNVSSVGYLDSEGEFVPVALNNGLRDVLYINNVNPIRIIQNVGPVVYGNKTRSPIESQLDRVNVARLANYVAYRAEKLVEPLLFQPNDGQTRKEAFDLLNRLLAEIVTLRGISEFLVVCDESNNTPQRVNRKELWIDVFVIPTQATEFIMIPLRFKNPGDSLSF